jgi:hypothetical protein
MEKGLYILDELKVPVVAAATIATVTATATATASVDLSPFRLSLSFSRFYL